MSDDFGGKTGTDAAVAHTADIDMVGAIAIYDERETANGKEFLVDFETGEMQSLEFLAIIPLCRNPRTQMLGDFLNYSPLFRNHQQQGGNNS